MGTSKPKDKKATVRKPTKPAVGRKPVSKKTSSVKDNAPKIPVHTYATVGVPLYNLGNTCFFNAFVQFFRNIRDFRLLNSADNPINNIRYTNLTRFIGHITKPNTNYNTHVKKFIETERKLPVADRLLIQTKNSKNVWNQEDCAEQLELFISNIPDFKILSSFCLYGYRGEYKDKKCTIFRKEPNVLEYLLSLPIPIPNKKMSIQNIVDYIYNTPEILDKSNNLNNPGFPQNQCIWTRYSLYGYYLILRIKLWNNLMQKVAPKLYPVVQQYLDFPTDSGTKHYELISVVYHSGSTPYNGHYYNYSYNSDKKTNKPNWYLYDDTTMKIQKPVEDKIGSPYILLYKIRDY